MHKAGPSVGVVTRLVVVPHANTSQCTLTIVEIDAEKRIERRDGKTERDAKGKKKPKEVSDQKALFADVKAPQLKFLINDPEFLTGWKPAQIEGRKEAQQEFKRKLDVVWKGDQLKNIRSRGDKKRSRYPKRWLVRQPMPFTKV